jgi:rubredoxin
MEFIDSPEALRVIIAAKTGKQSLYADPVDVLKRDTDGDFDLLKEMNDRQGCNLLWVRCRAIDADVVNANGDYFSADELLKQVTHNGKKVPAYKTFEGCPIHTNHDNKDIQKAKGEVVYAEWDEKNQCVWCTFYISEDAYPEISSGIRIGMIHDVSMGCTVESGICSVCGKEAVRVDDYCEHLKKYKGKKMPGTSTKVYEKNKGIKFIELSLVNDGAFDSCSISELYDQDELTQKALELNRRVASVKSKVLEAESKVIRFDSDTKKECENMLRAAMNATYTAVRIAQAQTDNPQFLAANGANANSTVAGILKALGMDARQQLNVLDLLNVALNFLEVAIMQMFTRKDNVDLQHVSKIAKAMSDLQGTMQDLIDDGVDSPVGAMAGAGGAGGGTMLTPGAQPQAAPTQPQAPASDYSATQSGVGQVMNPVQVSERSFTTEKPLNPLLGGSIGRELVWANKNPNEEREVYASRKSNDNIERFGQSILALAKSVGVDTLATSTQQRAANNEQPVKSATKAQKNGDTTKMINPFQRIASKLRNERKPLELSFSAEANSPETNHRIVVSTTGDIEGYYMQRLANWKPSLNDNIINAIEQENLDYALPILMEDFKNHVRTAQAKNIDIWSDMETAPEGETEVKENALDDKRQPMKGNGEIINEYVDVKRTEPKGERTREDELESKRTGTDDKVKEELLENAGLYARKDNGQEVHDFLVDDARCGCPSEHIELRIQARHGRNDKVETRKLASSIATELGRAAYAARVTPEEIIEVSEKIAQRDDLENLIALASLGTDVRERTAQRHAFFNNNSVMLGAENAIYHGLGKIVGDDVKSGDVVDALRAVISARDIAGKLITRVAKTLIENAPTTYADVIVTASREEQLRTALGSLADGETETSRGHLKAVLCALAGAADECQATPDEVINVIASKKAGDIFESIGILNTQSARESRNTLRQREEFYGKREASKKDVENTVFGWLSDFVHDGKIDSYAISEAASLLGARPVAASNLLHKLLERQASISVTDEKCTTKRLTATVSDFEDLDPKSNDFDQQFRLRAMDIFRQAGYDVDDGTFNLTNLSVDQSGNIQAEVSARLIKTFSVDGNTSNMNLPVESTIVQPASVETQESPMEDETGNLYTVSAMQSLGMQRNAQAAGMGGMGTPPAAPAGGGVDPLAGATDPMGGGFAAMTMPSESGMPGTEEMAAPENPDDMSEPGTKQPWGTICPVCGSKDVSIANGEGECQSCGAQLKFKLMVEATPSGNDSAAGTGGDQPDADPLAGMEDMGAAPAGDMGAAPPVPAAAPPTDPMMMQASWTSSPLVWQKYASAGQNVPAETAMNARLAMKQLPVGCICPGCGDRENIEKIRNKTICTACGTVAVSRVAAAEGKPNLLENTIYWMLD